MRGPVVITGAAGNVGQKLTDHLRARGYDLRLFDIDPRGDLRIEAADLSVDGRWADALSGASAIVHLAANASVEARWEDLTGPNIEAVLNLYAAARRQGVRKIVLASSVWAMAARRGDDGPIDAGPATPGELPYAISKAFAERVAAHYARMGVDTVAIRLGACRPGENPAQRTGDAWEDACWISNRDTCEGFERALLAKVEGFKVVNLTSAIEDGRWSLAETERLIGYRPKDRLPARRGGWQEQVGRFLAWR